jgi:hypothetical protein
MEVCVGEGLEGSIGISMAGSTSKIGKTNSKGGSLKTVIPSSIVEQMDWKDGDELRWQIKPLRFHLQNGTYIAQDRLTVEVTRTETHAASFWNRTVDAPVDPKSQAMVTRDMEEAAKNITAADVHDLMFSQRLAMEEFLKLNTVKLKQPDAQHPHSWQRFTPVPKENFIQALVKIKFPREDAERMVKTLYKLGQIYETKPDVYSRVTEWPARGLK